MGKGKGKVGNILPGKEIVVSGRDVANLVLFVLSGNCGLVFMVDAICLVLFVLDMGGENK